MWVILNIKQKRRAPIPVIGANNKSDRTAALGEPQPARIEKPNSDTSNRNSIGGRAHFVSRAARVQVAIRIRQSQ